jgi:pyrimidine operon attenuation protein/uracil phosphoribosyltransferase
MAERNYILSPIEAQYKLQRLALEVAEQLLDDASTPLIIIGIQNQGVVIANTIAQLLQPLLNTSIQTIACSMNKALPQAITLSEAVNVNNKNVLICDDVANSGKTLLYALKPLLNSHPKRIQTLVLVERMHKLFPVKPDYVGLSIATTLQENIVVEVETDNTVKAFIE